MGVYLLEPVTDSASKGQQIGKVRFPSRFLLRYSKSPYSLYLLIMVW